MNADLRMNTADAMPDWPRWLAHHRQGGDPAYAEHVRARVATYVDRLLDHAQLGPGMTLLDAGTGEGVVALRAIERIGPSLRVVLLDQSRALLDEAASAAHAQGVLGQCQFECRSLEDLSGIAGDSVDVLTTRSVLAYVADKPAAFRAFLRIVKPGGRIALAEPVFQDDAFVACSLRRQLESQRTGQEERGLALIHRWKAAQMPDTLEKMAANPLTNYSERDLLRMALGCGFVDAHLELEIRAAPTSIPSWEVLLDMTPHPWAPSLRELLERAYSPDEAADLEAILRARLASGQLMEFDRMAYLSAAKPRA